MRPKSEVLKSALVRFGLDEQARQVKSVVRPVYRRNRRDDHALSLLIALGLPKDGNCVDIGANLGTITEAIVKACPSGSHYAFEPLPHLAASLRNRFPQVSVQEIALSDEPGTAHFVSNTASPARSGLASTVRRPSNGMHTEFDVTVARLDDVLPPSYVPSLIKIDVEGNELQTLRGARETLRTHRPIVALEHGHGPMSADLPHHQAVYEELAAADLRVFDMDGELLTRQAFENVYITGERWNFLARR
jgi:FkbM family methyltransferase